jgi:hypothetical protein
MAFKVPAGSSPTLKAGLAYSAPTGVRAGYLIQIVLWAAAIVVLVWERRRRVSDGSYSEPTDRAWFTANSAPPARRGRTRRGPAGRRPVVDRSSTPADPLPDPDSDEVWTDV